MRTHIARFGMDHYKVYREGCVKNGIPLNERGFYASGQSSILQFVERTELSPEEWQCERLLDLIVRFIVETDQVGVEYILTG